MGERHPWLVTRNDPSTPSSLEARVKVLEEALREARQAIIEAARDTLWCSDKWPAETVVDHIDDALLKSEDA